MRPPASYLPTFDPDDGLHTIPGVGFTSPNQTSFPLRAAAAVLDANFGYFGTGQVGDRVWNDLNADGVQDANEPGIAGVVITLTGGTTSLTTTTDSTGYYAFGSSNVLGAGTYTVTATPPPGFRQTFDRDDGWQISSFSTPNSVPNVVLGVGQILTDVDFGYTRPSLSTASIGDRVWSDTNGNGLQDIGEIGIAGVTVVLSAPIGPAATNIYTATDANGF